MSIWSRIERRLTQLAGEIIPDEFRDQLALAEAALDRGDVDEACELLQAMLGVKPEHAVALVLLGHAELRRGNHADARRAFEAALAVRDDLAEAALGLGEAAIADEALDDALRAFRRAIGTAAGEREVLARAYRGLGVVYRRQGELKKAIRELRKAVAEDPKDGAARALLGEALYADERVSNVEARKQLVRSLESVPPPALAHLVLGSMELDELDHSEAARHFRAALELEEPAAPAADPATAAATADPATATATTNEAGATPGPTPGPTPGGAKRSVVSIEARVGLGRVALAEGAPDVARAWFQEALAANGSKRAALHAWHGEALAALGQETAAAQAFARAVELEASEHNLGRALELAIKASDTERMVQLANDLLSRNASHGLALVARGRAQAQQGDEIGARALFEAAIPTAGLSARLELAELCLGQGRADEAASLALEALRLAPESDRASALLTRAHGLETGIDPAAAAGDSAMYQLAVDLGRLCERRPALRSLVGDTARAASDFDQPLLVTVMGEFSSGKSSFINAFIGGEVAPTGITPTTATINVVKYGRERQGRIRYRDGRVVTIAGPELLTTLSALGDEEAKTIDLVEILEPLEALQRVNLVDTPGLNSILPEHEQTARGFIARADAVVWLFTAGQTGKKSERAALQKIRDEGKRVLSVLNKRDQLNPAEVAEIVGYVERELGELVEVVVPFSARDASRHRRGEAPTSDGNLATLERTLEERFFSRALELKREVGARRLGDLIERARALLHAEARTVTEAAGGLAHAIAAIDTASTAYLDEHILAIRSALNDQMTALYREAAREVLELVRPRRIPFGTHSATPADRDYLSSLLSSGFEAVLLHCQGLTAESLRSAGARAISALSGEGAGRSGAYVAELQPAIAAGIALVDAQVYARAQAYLQGYLAGGYVESFFVRALPHAELTEDAIYHALVRDAPDLDAAIALPLGKAGVDVLFSLRERLLELERINRADELAARISTVDVLEAIDGKRRELAT